MGRRKAGVLGVLKRRRYLRKLNVRYNIISKGRISSLKGDMMLSHTLFFLFSIAMIITIVVTFGTIRKDTQNFIGNNEIQQVCTLIRTSIEKIYIPSDYMSPSNTTQGKIIVDLPERIADANYRARFVNSSIVIETSIPAVNKTCEAGFDVNFTGSTSGGRTQLEWVTYGSGSNSIIMARVRE